jgi:archaellum biogenesis ATPase FlaH
MFAGIYGTEWPTDDNVITLQGERTSRGRNIVVRTASTITPLRVEWLVKNFIPKGAITLLSGREGLGKSLLSLHWAALITLGKLGERAQDVIIITAEDSPAHVIVPRLSAAGADLSRVHFLEAHQDGILAGAIVLPIDINALEQVITKHDVGLLIIDPLSSSLSPTIDSHKDASVRQALDPLSKMADRTQVSVIAVMHLNKGQGVDLNSRVMGSRAFIAVARANIVVALDPEDESQRVAALAKSNLGPTDIPAIGFRVESRDLYTGSTGVAIITGERLIALSDLSTPSEDQQEQNNAASWLLDHLSNNGGEAPKVDIERAGRAVGYSPEQLRRAREVAGVISVREKKLQAGSIWRLPTNG